MPRAKGSGKGWVSQVGGVWLGRWREYPKGEAVVFQHQLGAIQDVTEAEAKYALKIHISSKGIAVARSGKTVRGSAVFKCKTFKDKQALLNRGSMGEMIVATDLLSRGFDVFRSVGHSASCDLVGILNGKTYRIEVKVFAMKKDGTPGLCRRVKHGLFEILAVVNSDGLQEIHYDGLPE